LIDALATKVKKHLLFGANKAQQGKYFGAEDQASRFARNFIGGLPSINDCTPADLALSCLRNSIVSQKN